MLKFGTRFMLTGGASGIGAATAELLVARGHRVAVCDVNREATLNLCAKLGERAHPLYLDVRQYTEWERALNETWNELGGVDVLINNAGLVHTGLSHEVPLEKLSHMVDVNLVGVINGVHSAVPRFLEQGYGHVINTASLASFIPLPGTAVYAATKHAVRAFTHGCAIELGDTPVKFTLVCPGAVETPMLAKQVDDDAAALSFSDKPLAPQSVAQAILKAAEEQPREILVPPVRGNLLRLAGAFPGIVNRMFPAAQRRGRAELARRRALMNNPG